MGKKKRNGSPTVMAFYHQDGFVPAWKQASRFAGEDGRIATMPDVVNARIRTEPKNPLSLIDSKSPSPWDTYFTTTTAEYMGRSRGGVKILIVAHGIGPMATLDGICKAYSYEYKDKKRNRHGGRISQKEFRDLENGKYGEVTIVDLDALLKRYEYPFLSILAVEQALSEPLLLARLGPRAVEYIRRHEDIARRWHKEQSEIDSSNPFIIRMGGAANCSYKYYQLEDGLAFAHLISAGGLTHVCHDGKESLVADIDCNEWWNGVRLVGIRSGNEVIDMHPGVRDISGLIHRNWQSLMVPIPQPSPVGFRALMKVGNVWFTQYSKQGARMDTAEPEFLVSSIEPVGDPVDFVTTIGGYHRFFKYDIKEVQSIAPPEANAYETLGDVDMISNNENPTHHRVSIQFYKVDVDNTQRLIRDEELRNDYDHLMNLLLRES